MFILFNFVGVVIINSIHMHFSMRVGLSDFFNDARSYSLVFVDTSWENLKDLQDHIQNLFQLVGRKQRSSLTFNINT